MKNLYLFVMLIFASICSVSCAVSRVSTDSVANDSVSTDSVYVIKTHQVLYHCKKDCSVLAFDVTLYNDTVVMKCKNDLKSTDIKCAKCYSPSRSYSTNRSYNTSRTVYTGPRGGRYYINSHGNKTYIKRK